MKAPTPKPDQQDASEFQGKEENSDLVSHVEVDEG